jgi:3-hydroxyacyl-[acyl-carrier-protein] dehydratase
MTMYQNVKDSMISSGKGDRKNTLTGEFCFNENLNVFKGHFPGLPVLPGVMQIEMIQHVMKKNTGISYKIKSIKKAKFNNPIVPGEAIKVSLSFYPLEDDSVNVKAVVSVGEKTSGKIAVTLLKP